MKRQTNGAGIELLLTPEEVSAILSLPVETLYQWRRRRIGPPGFRVGRHLRYDPDEFRQWLKSMRAGAA